MVPESGCLAGSRTESDPNARTRQPQQGTFGSDSARTHGEGPREQCESPRCIAQGQAGRRPVRPHLSVRGVMTSRGVLPRYSYEYWIWASQMLAKQCFFSSSQRCRSWDCQVKAWALSTCRRGRPVCLLLAPAPGGGLPGLRLLPWCPRQA